MPRKKDKIPAPGGKKDPYTNFMKKSKWQAALRTNTLDIAGRNIQKEGSVIVSHALMRNIFIQKLDLTQNHLGDAGITEFAQMLKMNVTIRVLHVGINDMTDVGGVMLASAFLINRTVTHIYAPGNAFGDDTAAAFSFALKQNREIKHLNLSWNAIGPKGAQALARVFTVNSDFTFDIYQNRIGDDGTKALCGALKQHARASYHHHLNLWQNDIGKVGALAIAELLEKNNGLISLNLSWNSVGTDGAEAIGKAMQVNVGCGVWRPVTEEEAQRMAKSLLDDGYKKVEDGKFQRQNEMKTIPGTVWVQDVDLPCCTITDVNLSQNLLGDRGAIALGELIGKNAPLTNLNLSHNLVGNAGGIGLAEGLKASTTLTSLNLSHNKIGDAAAPGFAEVISTSVTLQALSLQRNEMREEGKTLISDSIPKSTKMRINYGALDDMAPLTGMYGGAAASVGRDSHTVSRSQSRKYSSVSALSSTTDSSAQKTRSSRRKSVSRGSTRSDSTSESGARSSH